MRVLNKMRVIVPTDGGDKVVIRDVRIPRSGDAHIEYKGLRVSVYRYQTYIDEKHPEMWCVTYWRQLRETLGLSSTLVHEY